MLTQIDQSAWMAHDPSPRMMVIAPPPNSPGNKYLDEDTLLRYAAERGRILSRVGEQPQVQVMYVTGPI